MARNGRSTEDGVAEISVVCPGCDAAIHVAVDTYVDGGETTCPECETTCDLDEIGDGLLPRDVLLDRVPAEARMGGAPILSEFPSPG